MSEDIEHLEEKFYDDVEPELRAAADVNAYVRAHEEAGYLLPPQFIIRPDAIRLSPQIVSEPEVNNDNSN